MVPSIQVSPGKLHAYTNSVTCLESPFFCSFVMVCLLCLLPLLNFAGISRSKRVLGCRPKRITAGAIPMVKCGVVLYCERKRDTRVSIDPLISLKL